MKTSINQQPIQFKRTHKLACVIAAYIFAMVLAFLFKQITGQPIDFSSQSIEWFIGGTIAYFTMAFFIFKLYTRDA